MKTVAFFCDYQCIINSISAHTRRIFLKIILSNPFVIIFLAGSVLSFLINQYLEFIDYKSRCKNGGKLPEILKNIPAASVFDEEKLAKICNYENEKYFRWIVSSSCKFILDLALVFAGFYPFVFNFTCSFLGFPSGILNSFLNFFLFMILTSIPGTILDIPFSLHRNFVTEKKYGFSNMTFKLWLGDFLKNLILGILLSALICFVASFFIVKCPKNWWWILSIALIAFTFIMQIVYPKFIAPLFNKFEPLPDGELKDKISEILVKTGFKNDGLFVMDASKRSGHSNAYFSGFGKSKRIVLYDTLIKQLTTDELVAVLGHELGHFKLKHITKKLIFTIPLEFVVIFVLYLLAQLPAVYTGFRFDMINSANIQSAQFIGLLIAVMIYSSISEIISPLLNFTSRKDEYAADAFSAKVCGTPEPLISGLIKLNSENLSELLPPPLYVFWNYNHPTLIERIKALKKAEK